jgi:hypothetical protein
MINPVMLLMSLLGRLLERPALPRAKGTGVFNPFRRLPHAYSAYDGAEDCD